MINPSTDKLARPTAAAAPLPPAPSGRIRVMVVDDAVVIRKILTDALAGDPEIEVVGTAANGRLAMAKLDALRPDVVTLDVEMPEMDGLATLREIRKVRPRLPVIMFSTLTARGAGATLDALSAGASDYVTKPANVGSVTIAIARIREELIPKIKALCGRAATATAAPGTATATAAVAGRPIAAGPARLALPRSGRRPIEAVVIGISTGGPNALAEMMPSLPADLPVPVLIVQHMPPVFTRLLAERLAVKCPLPVQEAAANEPILPGRVYIAPGDFHMVIERSAAVATAGPRRHLTLTQAPPENSCRPAVDVLFRSAAAAYGAGTLALVLTGMGSDGLHGCEAIRDAGGLILAQDEATSTVWGMPGFVARAGLAEQLLPLGDVARTIGRLVHDSRLPRRASA